MPDITLVENGPPYTFLIGISGPLTTASIVTSSPHVQTTISGTFNEFVVTFTPQPDYYGDGGDVLIKEETPTSFGPVDQFTAFHFDITHVPQPPTLAISNNIVNEHTPGTFVGTLSGGEPDGAPATFNFQIESDPSGLFVLQGHDLFLKAGATTDFNTQSSYNLLIRTTNDSGLSTDTSVTVKVRGVVFTPSAGAQSLPADILLGGLTVANPGSGTTFTYSLVGGETSLFQILKSSSNTFGLYVPESAFVSFFSKSSHDVTVRVTDSSGHTFDQVLHVTVPATIPGMQVAQSPGQTITGTSGNDVLLAVAQNDSLIGGAGSDLLVAEAGGNVLTGGAGNDKFIFGTEALGDAEGSLPTFGRITDYDQGNSGHYAATEGDQIDLSALLSSAYNHGNGQPVGSLVRVITSGTGARLQVDPDGNVNGANWVTIARLDNLKIGETVNVVLDSSSPAGITVPVVAGPPSRDDFNADGTSDLLFQNTDGTPAVWLMNGLGVMGGTAFGNPGPSWHVAAAGDFNFDGKADILWQNTDGLPAIWEMNGTSFLGSAVLSNPGASWHIIATGDFNGDNKPDILWQNTDGTAAIWELNGTSFLAGAVLPNPGPNWHVIGAGDFNNDGKADILWQNTDGLPAIWEMNGTSIVGAGALSNPGASWHAIATGDFNGDGKVDILWQNADGLPAIWEMNGTSVIATGVLPNPGSSWHAIGTSDLNGDGNADIVWQNANGTPAIWEMNGTSIIATGVLTNPGAAWQVKDDGPIPPDQMGAAPAGSASPPGGILPLGTLDSSLFVNSGGDPTHLLAPGAQAPNGLSASLFART